MIIQVSELLDDGLTFEDVAQFPTPFSDPAWRLEALSLHLVREGVEVLVQGEIAATVPQACGRCLEVFPARVKAFVNVRLAPRPTTAVNRELAPDDLDTDFYVNDELDLSRLIETETTLALPMKPLCQEACRGLCPVCGANRNVVTCACDARPPDPRLAPLTQWTARHGR